MKVVSSSGNNIHQPLCSLWYKMYACNRTHHQRQKRTGAGEIIARRAFVVTSGTGTSGTATATNKIMIMYGCLIPSGLSNHTLPRTEPWLGWGRRPGKKYGGCSREADTMKVRCRRTRGGGRSVLPDMAMVRMLEATMAEYWRREY